MEPAFPVGVNHGPIQVVIVWRKRQGCDGIRPRPARALLRQL